jgi:hypothetical protein
MKGRDQLTAALGLRKTDEENSPGQLGREAALLMMHLGWTEHKVMSLPGYRRRMYFQELCELYGGYDEAVKAVRMEKTKEQWEAIEFIEWYEGYEMDARPELLM